MKTKLIAAALLFAALPMHAQAADTEELKKVVDWARPATNCEFPEFAAEAQPGDIDEMNKVYRFDFAYAYETAEDTKHPFTLYELHCSSGAYNVSNIYVTLDFDNKYQLLSFASPRLDFTYTDEEKYTELKGKPKFVGYSSSFTLTNSSFDPETKTISAHSSWRGLDDAWSEGVWSFNDGEFLMTSYQLDPIYNLNDENANQDEDRPQDIIKVFP